MTGERDHRPVIGVGGVVRTEGGVLLVRLTYSRHRGKFMFPGGKVQAGESLEAALVREVCEETGVQAEPRGILAVRHRVRPAELNTYLMFLMDHVAGEPRSASPECDAVGAFGLNDFDRRPERFVEMVPPVARPVLEGRYTLFAPSAFVPDGYPPDSFRLYGPGGGGLGR